MTNGLCELVRQDHDDHERTLAAMVDPRTRPNELYSLLDFLQLAIAVHAAAEARVLSILLAKHKSPRALAMIAAQTRMEHRAQRAILKDLLRISPGSLAWYDRTLELRVLAIDHAARADYARWTYEEHLGGELRHQLAAEYATDRMQLLSTTSPIVIADSRESVVIS
jgi:hypothetical protein